MASEKSSSDRRGQRDQPTVGNITDSDAIAIGSGATAIKTGDVHVDSGGVFLIVGDGHRMPLRAEPEVSPARPGETLALIAQFDGDGQSSWKIEERVYQAVKDTISRLNANGLRVARVRNVIVESGDDAKAREIAASCGAAMIIWGWYDQVGFTPRFTMTTPSTTERTLSELPEIMVDTSDHEFRQYMFRGLADQMAFLATLTVGQLLYWDHRYAEALAAFDLTIAHAEATQVPAPQLALVHFYRAFLLATRNHDVTGAASGFASATELDPNFTQAFYNLGDAQYFLKQYDAAIASHSRALELNPNHLYALLGRGDSYMQLEQYDAAISDYTAALDIRPWTRTYIARARAFELSGRKKLAQGDYYQARELDPFCDVAEGRLKPPSVRGQGKMRSVEYDLEHAPGPTFVASYETALRILGRATPPPIQTAASEDTEAVQLAQLLARVERSTGFYFESLPRGEESDFEEAGRSLPRVLLNDGPDYAQTAAVLDLLYRYAPMISHQGVRDLIREILLLPTLRARFGDRLLESLELFTREGFFYSTGLRILGRPLLTPLSTPVVTVDRDAQHIAALLNRLLPGRGTRRLHDERHSERSEAAKALIRGLEEIDSLADHLADDEYFIDSLQELRKSSSKIRSAVESLFVFPPLREKLGARALLVIDLLCSQDPFYDKALKALGRPLVPPTPREANASIPEASLSADPEAQQLAGLLRALHKASRSADDRLTRAAESLERAITWADADPNWYRKEVQIIRQAGRAPRAALQAVLNFPGLREKWGMLA
jgi:tetratricopeptide (TPR) repeat protein